ncbi:MAG: lamin tail domain-containing protein [Planctomycetales bacterium]|nr:lamin tail domain-containing protein [Planctomycetales bacterium]
MRTARLSLVQELEQRVLLDAAPVVTEFRAASTAAHDVVDGFGETPDWIELANPSSESMRLDDFYLSDDIGQPRKWKFPSDTRLEPGEQIVVMASGRNVRDGFGYLHTNFSLKEAGESLLLSNSTGLIDQVFVDYPIQRADATYGRREEAAVSSLVSLSSSAEVRFVDAPDPSISWLTGENTGEQPWQTVANGIGFERHGIDVDVSYGEDAVKIHFQRNELLMDADGKYFDSTQDGWSRVLVANGIRSLTTDIEGVTLRLAASDVMGNELPLRSSSVYNYRFPDSYPDFTLSSLVSGYVGVAGGVGNQLLVELSGLLPNTRYELSLLSLDSRGGVRPTSWLNSTNDLDIPFWPTFSSLPPRDKITDEVMTHSAVVESDHDGIILIRGICESSSGGILAAVLNGLKLRQIGVAPMVATNVEKLMFSKYAVAELRYVFDAARPALPDLRLQTRFDGGFIAYLNGHEIARGGVSQAAPNTWSVSAERRDDLIHVPVTYSVPGGAELLNSQGDNVLAVVAFNADAADPDFYFSATLESVGKSVSHVGYFVDTTPGAPNSNFAASNISPVPVIYGDVDLAEGPRDVRIIGASGWNLSVTLDGSVPTPYHGQQYTGVGSSPPAVALQLQASTVVRAISYRSNWLSSSIVTATFRFLDSIVGQGVTPTVPAQWTTQSGKQVAADYDVDGVAILQWEAATGDSFSEALTRLPSIGLTVPPEQLWGVSGIYEQPERRDLRGFGAIEMWSKIGYSTDAAVIEIQGNTTRDPLVSKQHSFRVKPSGQFSQTFVESLFGEDYGDVDEIVLWDTLVDSRQSGTLLRDIWLSEMSRSAAVLAPHKSFVHVYLNGMYWGLYSLLERPTEEFFARRLGGDSQVWDVVKDGRAISGSMDTWNQVFDVLETNAGDSAYRQLSGLPLGDDDQTRPQQTFIDMDNFIDYSVIHFLGRAQDWQNYNWIAYRDPNKPNQGFQFCPWDQERLLNDFTVSAPITSHSPRALFNTLTRTSAEFRARVADRVVALTGNDGPWSQTQAVAQWQRLVEELRGSVIADIARWGDVSPGNVLTFDGWQENVAAVANSIIPANWRGVLQEFGELDLLGAYEPPHVIRIGDELELVGDAEDSVFFTTDGTDPLTDRGTLNATAVLYQDRVRVAPSTLLCARSFRQNVGWSPLVCLWGDPNTRPASAASLRVTEISYHPAADESEFIELTNVADHPIDIRGVKITSGVTFDFALASRHVLAPGQRAVIVQDIAKFAKYHDVHTIPVLGQYDGKLANEGETLTVVNAAGMILQVFTYGALAPWPVAPDGNGPSLELIEATYAADDATHWRPSSLNGGTPGSADVPIGDVDGNRRFTVADLLSVFQQGRYEIRDGRSSLWNEGDWNGDGVFDSADLVFAFRIGVFNEDVE